MKQTKHLLATIAMLLCSLTTSAHDFEVDGIYYNITSSTDHTLEVTYKGDLIGIYVYTGTVTIPAVIRYGGTTYQVTSIGGSAFKDCFKLTSVTIPESVTSIGDWAFSGCYRLTSITIPENSKLTSIGYSAFNGCSSLTSITIPESVTSIEYRVFNGCSRLTSIVLPCSLNYINSEAFADCGELLDVYCNAESVPSTKTDAFSNTNVEYATLHVPASAIESYKATAPWSSFGTIVSLTEEKVTSITLSQSSVSILTGSSLTLTATVAPADATDSSVTWSSSDPSVATVDNIGKVIGIAPGAATITAIANDGSGVSAQCEVTVTNIATVEIDGIWYNLVPKAKEAEVIRNPNVGSLGASYSSSSIIIPSTVTNDNVVYKVTSVGDDTFAYCRSLISITLPEGVTTIGIRAFESCSSLSSINIPEGMTSIEKYAFRNCSSLTSIAIPGSVIEIGGYAFYKCSSLTSITIPGSVIEIGSYAFSGCSSLTAITIPESLTSIVSGTFENCSKLATIVLPMSFGSIVGGAFANCPELTDVYCYAESVPRASANAFEGSYSEYATLHVPSSALASYQATSPWSSFGNIVALDVACATPVISYADGKVVITCETEGAKVNTTVTNGDDQTFEMFEFDLIPTYTITAYATKEDYLDSETTTVTLCWIDCSEEHENDDTDGIITIPSRPVLIQTDGGVITLTGLAEGTEVAVYDLGGTQQGTAVATDGTATITTALTTGSTAIVKIGERSVKVVVK